MRQALHPVPLALSSRRRDAYLHLASAALRYVKRKLHLGIETGAALPIPHCLFILSPHVYVYFIKGFLIGVPLFPSHEFSTPYPRRAYVYRER